MTKRRKSIAPLDPEKVITDWITRLEKRLAVLERPKMSSLQTVSDTINLNDPQQGMVVINATTGSPEYYHDNEWWPLGDIMGIPYRQELNGSTLAAVIKATPGRPKGWACYDAFGAVPYHIHLYNMAAAPSVGTDDPLVTIGVPAGGGSNLALTHRGFTVGIAVGLSVNEDGSGGGPPAPGVFTIYYT